MCGYSRLIEEAEMQLRGERQGVQNVSGEMHFAEPGTMVPIDTGPMPRE
jgi:hypothetical protein